MTPKTQVHCRQFGDCLPVVPTTTHSRLDQRASRQTSIVHTMIIFRCDQAVLEVSRADPNFEELSQSSVIAFMDAITMTAWSFRQRLGPAKRPCIHRSWPIQPNGGQRWLHWTAF